MSWGAAVASQVGLEAKGNAGTIALEALQSAYQNYTHEAGAIAGVELGVPTAVEAGEVATLEDTAVELEGVVAEFARYSLKSRLSGMRGASVKSVDVLRNELECEYMKPTMSHQPDGL